MLKAFPGSLALLGLRKSVHFAKNLHETHAKMRPHDLVAPAFISEHLCPWITCLTSPMNLNVHFCLW